MRGFVRGLVLASALVPVTARAGGFYVPEVGARATGMGAAVVADGDDPSATFHDPANLVHVPGVAVDVAADLVLPRVTFFRHPLVDPNTGASLHFPGASNTNPVVPVPFAGASWRVHERAAVGLAVYAPFGAAIDFPADGAQRQLVTSLALRTIFVSPAAAVEVAPGLAVGASANIIYGDLVLDQRNAIPYVTGDPELYPDPQGELQGTTHLTASDAVRFGATFGISYRRSWLSLGASVMTPVTLHMHGDARVTSAGISALVDDAGNELQPAGLRTDQINVAIPLPLIARLGGAARVAPGVRIEADLNWTRWSSFQELLVDFVHEYELIPSPGANLYDVHVRNAWHDSWTARVGVEAEPFARPIALRAGLVLDQSPIDDRYFSVLTPDSDKLGLTAGARWARVIAGLDLELAVAELFVRERDIHAGPDDRPGSAGTILNKPAPSFYHGVTRAGFTIISLAVAWRM